MTDAVKVRPRSPAPMLRTLILFSLCCGMAGADPEDAPRIAADTPRAIVVQNYYYALPGRAADVYQWRLHASDVRAKLGLRRGRVLRHLSAQKGEEGSLESPDVIWECDYPSVEARNADVARLDNSKEFDEVQKHMQTLIRDFRRAIFETTN